MTAHRESTLRNSNDVVQEMNYSPEHTKKKTSNKLLLVANQKAIGSVVLGLV